MADHLLAAVEAPGEDEIFVYMGGDQVVPFDVRRARIHKDVKIIPLGAFHNRRHLISVEFHDGVEIIERYAFSGCRLRSVKLLGIRIMKEGVFCACKDLTDVEFGDQLEKIENSLFCGCTSLRNITMPNVKTIGVWAFSHCEQLTDLELPEGLETLQGGAFLMCTGLRCIAMPLKDDMIEADDAFNIGDDNVFNLCPNLTAVDLVGGIHSTVASLYLESWRNEMKREINRINQTLPTFIEGENKTAEIQQWMSTVISRLDHYKAQHHKLLKEATTLLELALWKANLDNNEGGLVEREGVRTTRGQRKRARKEISITSGASIVIKNVLPFLELNEDDIKVC